jgi:hypothetical protein
MRRERPDAADQFTTGDDLGQDRSVELDVVGQQGRNLLGRVVSALTERA